MDGFSKRRNGMVGGKGDNARDGTERNGKGREGKGREVCMN